MNKLAKYIVAAVVCAVILFLAWYFSSVLTCIILSAVFSLIGKPVMEFLTSIKIGRFRLGNSVASLLTMILLASVLSCLIIFIVPLFGTIIKEMSAINIEELRMKLAGPLAKYNIVMHEAFPTMDASVTIENMVVAQLKEIFDFSLVSNTFSSITSFIIDLFISAFTIVFVTFFFLKDSNMFTNIILLFVPSKYEENTKRAMESINRLLVRYFTGISLEALLITILNTIGLHFIGGLSFQLSVVLALISGVINVVPYIGPLAAGAFGTLIGVASLYGGVGEPALGVLIIKLVAIFVVTHLVDVFIFQPYIYSNSVKAHPLEIFLVILLAGNIGGIVGMLVAIPGYTVLRVFAKEFFSNFELVQKLTERIGME